MDVLQACLLIACLLNLSSLRLLDAKCTSEYDAFAQCFRTAFTDSVQPSAANVLRPLFLSSMISQQYNETTRCVKLEAAWWGLGSTLNNWFLGTLFSRIENPGADVLFDYGPSPYTCPGASANGLGAILDPSLLPWFMKVVGHPRAMRVNQDLCKAYDFSEGAANNNKYLNKVHTWFYSGNASPELSLWRHSLARRALTAELCPIVSGFWGAIRADIRAATQALIREHVNVLDQAFVAIQARGGDKARETPQGYDTSMSRGMQALAQQFPQSRGAVCFIIGDDHNLGELIRQNATSILGCSKVVMRTPPAAGAEHEQMAFNNQPADVRCEATKQYLMDVDLMASATYFIGMSVSNVAVVAYQTRSCVYNHDLDTYFDGNGAADWKFWA